MKICESECIPVPFKAVCPQVSSLRRLGPELGQLLVLLGKGQGLAFPK